MTHYELREWHSDYDLCLVNENGTVITVAAEIHDRDIVDRIAECFDATIIPEGTQGALGVQVEEIG